MVAPVWDDVLLKSTVGSAPGPQLALRMSSSCSSGTSRDLASLARFPGRDCSKVNATNPARDEDFDVGQGRISER
jgi:hypothetical protein